VGESFFIHVTVHSHVHFHPVLLEHQQLVLMDFIKHTLAQTNVDSQEAVHVTVHLHVHFHHALVGHQQLQHLMDYMIHTSVQTCVDKH
jgi:hypothetical protein